MNDQRQIGIRVTGNAATSVSPDRAEIRFGVSLLNDSAKKVKTEGDKLMSKLCSAMNAAGVVDLDMNTESYSLRAKFEEKTYERNTGKFLGYGYENHLMVLVRDLGRVSEMADAGVATGVQLLGIQFECDPKEIERAEKRAYKEAMADALEKSEIVASAGKVSVGLPLDIDIGGHHKSRGTICAAAPMNNSIRVGDRSIHVQVVVLFDIKGRRG